MGPHDPCHVANYFIERGLEDNKNFTPLQIQKLVYFSHGWMLGVYHRPLLDQSFEAWPYGPVMPVIYHNLSFYGGDTVSSPILARAKGFADDEENITKQVFDVYGDFSGIAMSRMTHVRGGPWDKTWRKHKRPSAIPNDVIEKHFADIIRRSSADNG